MKNMARQRTFELVPTTLIHPNAYKPPMTSKQVKRAYQKGNQKDKLTREEQRLLEAKELKRLRLENLREKASAKARVAKENKISKALVDAQLRKKSGLPPKPNQYMRSRSQPTISFYAGLICSTTGNRQDKKTKANIDSDLQDKQVDEDEGEDLKQDIMKYSHTKKASHESYSSEDEFGGFPLCSQLEMIVTSIDSKGKSLIHSVPQMPKTQERPLSKLNPQLPELQPDLQKKRICEDHLISISQEALQSAIATQCCSWKLKANQKQNTERLNSQTEGHNTNELSQKSCHRLHLCDSHLTSAQNYLKFSESSLTVSGQHPLSCQMSHLQESPSLKADMIVPLVTSDDNNTVDFEFPDEFLEDFLSSPTQEIEHFDVDINEINAADFPSNTQIMTEINSTEPSLSENSVVKASPELHLTKLKNCHDDSILVKSLEPDSQAIKQQDSFDNFISTQDLVILSQELWEINAPISEKPSCDQKPLQEKVKEKKRFFEEKEEDLLKAAIYESKKMMSKNNVPQSIRQELELSVDTSLLSDYSTSLSSPGTDYGADDFAGNEWEEISALCEPCPF